MDSILHSLVVVIINVFMLNTFGKFNIQTLPNTNYIPTVQTTIQLKSNSCVNDINNFLATYPRTPWKGFGVKFVNAVKGDCKAAKWLVAIGCTESSCGRNATNYNFAGLKGYNCKKVKCNKYGFEMFANWEDAINIIANRLYKPYLSKYSIDSYINKYCQSNCSSWSGNIRYFINKMSV